MKEKLAELIEAYSIARATNNRMLMEFAAGQLNAFIQKVEVSEPKPEIAEEAKTE
jgi:uncharacterized protein (UPF0335 family)